MSLRIINLTKSIQVHEQTNKQLKDESADILSKLKNLEKKSKQSSSPPRN